jgi:hypothetical protein
MEPRFDHDFGKVRVHHDAKAADSAQAVAAQAYTVGHHIVFGAGKYARDSTARKLIAHELTHVVQQSRSGIGRVETVSGVDDMPEREAEAVADSISSSRPLRARISETGAPANRVFRYRDPKAFNFGHSDTTTLKEQQFADAFKQPWIEQVEVNFNGTKIDAHGDLAPSGQFEATYHPNAAALSPIKESVLGGAIVHGLTTTGSFLVTRIEGVGYNDLPFLPSLGEGPRLKYSKALNASMHFAVFFHKGEALHGGRLDIGSHGCVHVPIAPTLRQLNYHSVVGRTRVKVAYDSSVANKVCCARMNFLGITKKGGLANPCSGVDPKVCP